MPDMPSHQDKMWIKLWKENSSELRERVVRWRKQNAVTRIDKPSRIQRARRLGYKAKQGIIVVRMRVGTGGMRKQRPTAQGYAFEEEIFPLGKYFIDVEYSGAEITAEFNLIDSNIVCIPGVIKPIFANWLTGNISDGFLMDAFQKYIDKEIIDIPFEINEKNVYEIDIPDWVKNVGYWWIEEIISDEDFAQVVNYLIDKKIISSPTEIENEV